MSWFKWLFAAPQTFELDELALKSLDELVKLSGRSSRDEVLQHALAVYHNLQERLAPNGEYEVIGVTRRGDGVLILDLGATKTCSARRDTHGH